MQHAKAVGDTRTLTLHHVHTDEDLTITYKKNGQYDEEALKKINWIMRDWRKNEAITMDRAGDRPALGGLSGGRRQGADPDRLRLPFARHQRNASRPQQEFRRRAPQPAHARQGHRLLHSRRSAREAPRHRDEAAGRRRRLLPDLGLAVRASRRRQRPRLAAHDARATGRSCSRMAAPFTCRPTATRCPAMSWRRPTSSAAHRTVAEPQKRSFLASLFSRDKDAEEVDDNAIGSRDRRSGAAQRDGKLEPASLSRQARAAAAARVQLASAAEPAVTDRSRCRCRRGGRSIRSPPPKAGRRRAPAPRAPRRSSSLRCRRTTSSTCAGSGTVRPRPRRSARRSPRPMR